MSEPQLCRFAASYKQCFRKSCSGIGSDGDAASDLIKFGGRFGVVVCVWFAGLYWLFQNWVD